MCTKNGGNHTALNEGIRQAAGNLFVVIDSDDWLVPSALEILQREWSTVADKEVCTGVCGLFRYCDGQLVGDHFPQDRLISNSIDLRMRLGVKGDKIGFTRIELMRRFEFPETLGQHVPKSLVWHRMSQEFDTLFINEVIGVKEYRTDGITSGANLNSYRNPDAYFVTASELLNGRRLLRLVSAARWSVTLAKCAFLARRNPLITSTFTHKLLTLLVMPLGLLLAGRDWWRARRGEVNSKHSV